MEKTAFERVVAEEFPYAVPERFRELIKNLVFTVEDEPSTEVRRDYELEEGETLLGLYTGVPLTARGDAYGVGAALPDIIILYQEPIEAEAAELGSGEGAIRRVIRETVWHEVAHHFGFDDDQVEEREARRPHA